MGIQVDTLVKGKDHYGKEFIDFEFDGKHISDFGMVAVFDGDRHTFSSTSEFEDETSEVAGVHGQYFWGTKLKPLEKEFSLATDGMTERQVNEFKQHFQPGRYGKFIECATSNRWRWARIAAAPEFQVVPFKKEIPAIIKEEKKQENGKEVINKITIRPAFYITEYKGEATIKFIFDNPYSYAISQRIDIELSDAQPEHLKTAYEDGIPFKNDINLSAIYFDTNTKKYIYTTNNNFLYNPSNTETTLNFDIVINKLKWKQDPNFVEGVLYIDIFNDEFNSPDNPYSIVSIQDNLNTIISACSFSAPEIFYSYNKIIKIINEADDTNATLEGLSDKLREEITHANILSYAIGSLNRSATEGKLINNWKTMVSNDMKLFFECDSEAGKEIILSFDGNINQVKLKYYLKNSGWVEENCGEIMRTSYLKLKGGDYLDDNFQTVTKHKIITGIADSVIKNINFEYTYI